MPTGAAVPALGGISNLQHVPFHVKYVQRTVLVTDAAEVTFVSINDRWHFVFLSLSPH